MNTVFTKIYDEPEYNIKEIMRYAGAPRPDERVTELCREAAEELRGKLSYRVCWCEFPVSFNDGEVDLTFARVNSDSLKKNLEGCESIVLFAATVGIYIDRMIAKYANVSPSKSLMFQAIGAERIESLCDMFNHDIKIKAEKSGKFTKPRFSPGYGDLDISLQREIFRTLDCPRKIGVSLNESLLMSPSKSVTAIIGITDKKTVCAEDRCSACDNYDCSFRSR